MTNRLIRYILLSFALYLTILSTATARQRVEGYWVASSPFFYGVPIAVIKTYIADGKLVGEIVKVMPLNGSIPNNKIAKSGPVMMFGYQEDHGRWIGGKIYEQTTARIYESSIEVSKNGNQLYVRGRKGPFFRTARWDRIK